MDTDLLVAIVAAAAAIVIVSQHWNKHKFEAYYGDGGRALYPQLLLNACKDFFKEVTRMERATFDALISELQKHGLLEDGRLVMVEEQLLIFLDIVCHNNSMRQTAVKFRRGLYTINRYFGQVLEALFSLYPLYVRFNPITCLLPPSILDNPKYAPFKNCLGALDGVFVPARVPLNMQSNYCSQKGIIAQNIMAAVNFNFEFVFVFAGWEGSAHDTRVFNNATSKGLNIPGNKYFLADAGYGLRKGLMMPY
ncbi:hypothetical protein PCANC_14486 [Puccinia coronata f. sp. avenae]|uniref:Uncharacterized protein n=1 Tax=Puccinia coronata f. sp. avenae TaxID=200324 RepID=A0A2N5SLX6_9BASI|nr:hypothetical protein PCANC_14486 [Puccinia coronata f. sp. avenae]